MQQPDNRRASSPANNNATKANTRPNPYMQKGKPQPTYRAKPANLSPVPPGDIMSQRAQARYQTEGRRRRIRTAFFIALGLLAATVVGVYAFVWLPIDSGIRQGLADIRDVFVTPASVRPAAEGGPGSTPVPVVFPDWGKKEPVNILLLGLDYRPEEEDSRADTMIIVHIDPAGKTASMVSIPRDLWVDIPGHGEGRINSTFQLGEKDPELGGGPGLAMATVEHNFDVKIHYFAQVDFQGFERIVDSLGGITLDVPRPLVDNEYPLGSYGVTRIYVPAGIQHMDGRTALQYARSRHADSDLGRNFRQQQVLLAIRQQGLSLNVIPRLNDLLHQLSGAVKTDLSLQQVGSLAQLAREIDRDSIETLLVADDMVTQTVLAGGADVLIPNWELIHPRIKQLFSDPRLVKEAARLSVQNGTTTGGVARILSEKLESEGLIIADLSSAENQGTYPTTKVIDYTGGEKPRTLEVLTTFLGIDSELVEQGDPSEARVANDGKPVDIVVIAGDDQISSGNNSP